MARRPNPIDELQSLRIVEDLDGFSCLAPDREATRAMQKRNLLFHLGMMAAFLTVILTIPAWLAALGSILLSAQRVSWKLRCTAHGVELSHVYTREEPGVAELRGEAKTKGPLPLGLGQPDPAELLPFSELEAVEWSEFALVLRMADGEAREVKLERTPRGDIARLGAKIREVFEGYQQGTTLSRAQAEAERRKLAAMAAASRGVQS
jgi:hypothetical protein